MLVYQNKGILDILSDRDYPKFILMNPNILPPVDIFPSKKKTKTKDIQGKNLDAT